MLRRASSGGLHASHAQGSCYDEFGKPKRLNAINLDDHLDLLALAD